MPTTISTPGPTVASMRFQEPYVSRGLNAKLRGLVGSGVVRGGRLATPGAGLNLTIQADPTEGDSVYSVFTADPGSVQLTVRQEGDVNLDLSAVGGLVVYICLYVDYTTSNATVVQWRAYTEAELISAPVAEAPYLVVLGRVSVPGVGPIPAANITPDQRRMAWDDAPASGWTQVVENGGFEHGPAAGTLNIYDLPGWERTNFLANPDMLISTSAPYEGAREFRFSVSAPVATSVQGLRSHKTVRVKPGDYVRARCRMRGALWTGASTQGIGIRWYDADLTVISTSWISSGLTGTFAYTTLDGVVEAPATAAWMRVIVGVDNGGLALGTGDLYFDDVKVWVEVRHPLDDAGHGEQLTAPLNTEMLRFGPQSGFTSMAEYVARSLVAYLVGRTGYDTAQMYMQDLNYWILDLFKGTIRLGGSQTTNAEAATPRVIAPAVNVVRTLLWQTEVTGYTEKLRIYFVRDEGSSAGRLGIEFTLNAYWDEAAALWFADNTAGTAVKSAKLVFANTKLALFEMNMTSSVAAGWQDIPGATAVEAPRKWDYVMFAVGGSNLGSEPVSTGGYEVGAGKMTLDNGTISFRNANNVESNPLATEQIAQNTLYAKTMIKAWVNLTSGVTLTKNDGVGIDSLVAVGNAINVNFFTGAEIDGFFCILVGCSDPIFVTANPITSTQVQIIGYNDAGAVVNLNSLSYDIYIAILGRQDG